MSYCISDCNGRSGVCVPIPMKQQYCSKTTRQRVAFKFP